MSPPVPNGPCSPAIFGREHPDWQPVPIPDFPDQVAQGFVANLRGLRIVYSVLRTTLPQIMLVPAQTGKHPCFREPDQPPTRHPPEQYPIRIRASLCES